MRTLKSGAGISFKYPARKFIFLKTRFIYLHLFISFVIFLTLIIYWWLPLEYQQQYRWRHKIAIWRAGIQSPKALIQLTGSGDREPGGAERSKTIEVL
jgi:hypothetical protein